MNTAPDLRVGAVQMNAALGDLEDNADRHRHWIDEARRRHLDLLVFPELSLTGYALGPLAAGVACSPDSVLLMSLAAACGDMQVMVGFVESASPGEIYNAVAVLQRGRVVAVHRKLNLPTYGGLEEGKWFHSGERLTLTEINERWRAAPLICADLWNPALVHAVMLRRPEILCAPINSASQIVAPGFSNEDNWPLTLRFHAMTYGTPVIMTNRYGPEGEHHFWGGSRILGARGETLAEAAPGESLIDAELSLEAIARARFELPTLRDANTPLILELLKRTP
ncbi:MAG: NAD+ synthetase [Salinicola sp.]|mgnify:CR=1 FL=1|uniref:nitrilase-related carbon-nitrogen hydrolase n=1 Tax=uncultured Salinicola sp. TaxID=1193542 RepID=UPI000C8A5C75|nr:nitrilase-related carbon-nitrogen hydrolase [uncultured Salinicola sp.]MAM56571.1 NAD+ synthetase [Salinicola sp.]